MKNKTQPIMLCAAVLASALWAAPRAAASESAPAAPAAQAQAPSANLRISFTFKVEGVQVSGNMVALNNTKASYQKAVLPKKSAKKDKDAPVYGTMAECLPSLLAGQPEQVKMSCLFQMSAPKPGGKAGELVRFELNSDFMARPGQALLLVDEPDKRLEVTVSRLP
ncbi:MAG: hypothetical protein GX410_04245 [Elusimicrobia bacterium]|nr:hypothetical protein [Elusimicrobiota bacterium]